MFTSRPELLCILFCNRLSLLICLGHCLPRYHRPGELSPQIRILPSVGFHSSGEPLSRPDVSLQRASHHHFARSPGHVANLEEMEIRRADVRYHTCDGGQEHDWRPFEQLEFKLLFLSSFWTFFNFFNQYFAENFSQSVACIHHVKGQM